VKAFTVRYRSRGAVREVRWADGDLDAEPLVETLAWALVRSGQRVRDAEGNEQVAALDTAEPAALTVLETLYEIGAHILAWDTV
jgi:hypothetical protein